MVRLLFIVVYLFIHLIPVQIITSNVCDVLDSDMGVNPISFFPVLYVTLSKLSNRVCKCKNHESYSPSKLVEVLSIPRVTIHGRAQSTCGFLTNPGPWRPEEVDTPGLG